MTSNHLEPATLEELRQLDSCTVANAIETFGVRLRNTGFTDSAVRCLFEDFPPLVGYAATVRVRHFRTAHGRGQLLLPARLAGACVERTAAPSSRRGGHGPASRVGSFIGDVHANILRALGCAGVVTNGAVRNIEAARALQFQMFARNLSVSHAFAHVFDFGGSVQIGKMQVRAGDLLHGDRHGVQTVPIEIAQKIPAVAHRMNGEEQEIIELCRSSGFTLEKLRAECGCT